MAQIDNGFSINPGPVRNLDSARNRETETAPTRGRENEDNRPSRTQEIRKSRDQVDVASSDASSPPPRLAEEEVRRNSETESEPPPDSTTRIAQPDSEEVLEETATGSPQNPALQSPPAEPPPEEPAPQAQIRESRSQPEPESDTDNDTGNNVEQLNQNPGALRGDNLGTDLALRENRGQRSLLQESRDAGETPSPPTRGDEASTAEPVRREQTVQSEAPRNDSVEQTEPRTATADRVVREDEINPPAPRNEPEAIQTQRGQNVNRLI